MYPCFLHIFLSLVTDKLKKCPDVLMDISSANLNIKKEKTDCTFTNNKKKLVKQKKLLKL